LKTGKLLTIRAIWKAMPKAILNQEFLEESNLSRTKIIRHDRLLWRSCMYSYGMETNAKAQSWRGQKIQLQHPPTQMQGLAVGGGGSGWSVFPQLWDWLSPPPAFSPTSLLT
jgi:hypothetical protein